MSAPIADINLSLSALRLPTDSSRALRDRGLESGLFARSGRTVGTIDPLPVLNHPLVMTGGGALPLPMP